MSDSSAGWIVDSHVHLHGGFDPARFLAAAARNLQRGAEVVGAGEGSVGCLIVMDTGRQQGFARLRNVRLPGWTLDDTDEACSLVLRHRDHLPVAVVSGRQVATAERLEVLAFPAPHELPDGEPVEQTIGRAREAGATVLLPWAFGKWSLARGRRVQRLMEMEGSSLLVGDNGNRPRWLPTPALIRRARTLGIPVLPGSDPLPLPFQRRRAGRCGAFVPCDPDLAHPASQLQRLLSTMSHQPIAFCRSEPLLRFALSQALLQLPRAFRRRWEGSAGS